MPCSTATCTGKSEGAPGQSGTLSCQQYEMLSCQQCAMLSRQQNVVLSCQQYAMLSCQGPID